MIKTKNNTHFWNQKQNPNPNQNATGSVIPSIITNQTLLEKEQLQKENQRRKKINKKLIVMVQMKIILVRS